MLRQPELLLSKDNKAEDIFYSQASAGIVDKAEEYLYSSARDYFYQKKCGLPDVVFL